MKYLIVGVSGSGKSTVENALWERGYRTIHIDEEPGLAYWINTKTKQEGTYIPGKVTQGWLDAHEWLWDKTMMTELLNKEPERPVFVVGVTSDILEQLHRFDKVFLLKIPPEIVRRRLEERPGKEEFGKSETEIDHVLRWQKEFEQALIQKGAIVIDSTKPIEKVVQEILSSI